MTVVNPGVSPDLEVPQQTVEGQPTVKDWDAEIAKDVIETVVSALPIVQDYLTADLPQAVTTAPSKPFFKHLPLSTVAVNREQVEVASDGKFVSYINKENIPAADIVRSEAYLDNGIYNLLESQAAQIHILTSRLDALDERIARYNRGASHKL